MSTDAWTTDKPTEPGVYVFHYTKMPGSLAVEVVRHSGKTLWGVAAHTAIAPCTIEDWSDGYWLGPLPEMPK